MYWWVLEVVVEGGLGDEEEQAMEDPLKASLQGGTIGTPRITSFTSTPGGTAPRESRKASREE